MTLERKLVAPVGISIALMLMGLFLRHRDLLALAIPFLLYTACLLYAGSAQPRPNLKLHRTLDADRIEENGRINVTLTVTNRGASTSLVGVTEQLPAALTVVEGEASCLRVVKGNERIHLRYALLAPRGEYTLPGVRVTSWHRPPLVSSATRLTHSTTFRVFPRREELKAIEIRPRRTRVYAGSVKANLGGEGLDFFGCREYSSGDSMRRVNWRAYAHSGSLVVNEYEQERIADVSIVLDARERVHSDLTSKEGTFDYAVRAAASMACHFLKLGNRVGLLAYGNYLDWTYPGYGKSQQERILDALARSTPADKVAFEDLRYIPTRLFPSRSQLVVISPLADENDVEILGLLRARGYAIILIAPNPIPFQLSVARSDEKRDLAGRILNLDRTALLTALRDIEVDIVDWDITQPLAAPASFVLSKKGRRFAW